MNSSDVVRPTHLARQAVIYIRQSSPHQVLSNQESLRLQYALRERALSLGWCADSIHIIDSDLGLTASSANDRGGFKDLLTRLALGQVGIILSTEVTRLSRNCSDWYPLLDLCGYKDCLIADGDGIYQPGSANGRLLLGLKGQLSEWELHTLRSRLTAGLLNKAARGELSLPLPVGLQRDGTGQVVKSPNQEVQDRIALIFSSFLRLKSASKVLHEFNAHELLVPRRDRAGDVIWKKPTVAAILATLKNPAYSGAFVYGRTRTARRSLGRPTTVRLPVDQWRIRLNNQFPAYISTETFDQIQTMLQDNYAEYDRNKSRGVPRPGAALLHGIMYCGECGHKMVVQYKTGTRYICNYLRQTHGVPVCQYIPADPLDSAVVAAFLQALSPIELDAYSRAMTAEKRTEESIDRAHSQQLERLRYEAALAERQFKRVDPDNRLVAAELENRWEQALSAVKQAEHDHLQRQQGQAIPADLTPDLREMFTAIGQQLPLVWGQDILTRQNKKALLRCLIDKVVAHRSPRDCLQVRIVWRGGDTSELRVRIPVGSFADVTNASEIERTILDLSLAGRSDDEIAQHLTELGHRSPKHPTRMLPSTVRTIRIQNRIFRKRSQSHPRHVDGYLTIPQLARHLGVSPHWLYHRISNGSIRVTRDRASGLYLFPDGPDTLQGFADLKDGTVHQLGYEEGHQDV